MLRKYVALVCGLFLTATAAADLEPWKDYEVSEGVSVVTTVRVASNMMDAYLEGIRNTWVPGVEINKELGHIEDYAVFVSDLPESGDFNLVLVVRFAATADLAPNKSRYEAFMREFGEQRSEETTEYAQRNYPAMRKITGEYLLRELTFK